MEFKFKLRSTDFLNWKEYIKYFLFGISHFSDLEKIKIIGNKIANRYQMSESVYSPHYRHDLPRYHIFTGLAKEGNRFTAFGGDVDSKEIAMSKMLGEFLERQTIMYPSLPYTTKMLSMEELRKIFNVHFTSDFNLPTEKQKQKFEIFSIDEDQKIECIPMKDIQHDRLVFYPIQSVAYRYKTSEKFFIAPKNSNGGAGGFSKQSAIVSAILELVERESFLLHWLTKTSARQIFVDVISKDERDTSVKNYLSKIEKIVSRLARFGIEVKLYDISSDFGIPVVLCISEDKYSKIKNNQVKKMVSTSSGTTFVAAILGALSETMQLSYCYTDLLVYDDVKIDTENPFLDEKIVTMTRRHLLFGENSKQADFFEDGSKMKLSQLMDINFDYEKILKSLKNNLQFGDIYCHSSREPFLKEIGYFVVKLVVPEMLPFHLEEHLARPISTRIESFLKFKGIGKKYIPNPFPHPLP